MKQNNAIISSLPDAKKLSKSVEITNEKQLNFLQKHGVQKFGKSMVVYYSHQAEKSQL